MLKRTKKTLAKFLLVCMMISNVFPAYAESTENLVRTEVTEEAPETDAISETEPTAEAEAPEASEQEEAPVNGVQEEPEVKAETPEAVPEVEEVPAEPVEEAGADGDLVCAEVIEAAEAVEAEDWDEGTGGVLRKALMRKIKRPCFPHSWERISPAGLRCPALAVRFPTVITTLTMMCR